MRAVSEEIIVQWSSQTLRDIGTPYFAEMDTKVLFYNYHWNELVCWIAILLNCNSNKSFFKDSL